MDRRDFVKIGTFGVATLVVGGGLTWARSNAALSLSADQTLHVTITDALKDMVTHNDVTEAQCYFWVYKMRVGDVEIPVECPGPTIIATKGDTIAISITNELTQPHSFVIPGMFDSGVIAPGATVDKNFTVTTPGAHLYFDNQNEPVNRVMGLHGALVVMPSAPSGRKFTPYDDATPAVQKIYDSFGDPEVYPGLAWEEGDATTKTPPFRQYVWLAHEASSRLFAEVGSLPAGEIYDPKKFVEAFLRDKFIPQGGNRIPEYFTINGQSGFFSHFSPTVTPMGRVGEPVVIHIMNAGLWTHSMHIHATHVYITSKNGVVNDNPEWIDVFTVDPMERIDYTVPFMRPPDMANVRGIGRPDEPLKSLNGTPVWPPVEEFEVFMPKPGEKSAKGINGNVIDLKQRLSPLCYPMHDHSEPSQTSQGGNYNCGMISGIYFVGDRNTPGHMDFPMDEDFAMMFRDIRGISSTGPAAGTQPDQPK